MTVFVSAPWMDLASSLIGVREVAGPKNSPTIMGWIKKLGRRLGIDVKDDETAWCGTFVAHIISTALPREDLPPVAVRAKAWATWGRELISPRTGCVLVFDRAGGGHVGFYGGETSTAYRVLGGNQGDAVSWTWIAKARCVAMRWPRTFPLPAALSQDARIAMTTHLAGPLSENEA